MQHDRTADDAGVSVCLLSAFEHHLGLQRAEADGVRLEFGCFQRVQRAGNADGKLFGEYGADGEQSSEPIHDGGRQCDFQRVDRRISGTDRAVGGLSERRTLPDMQPDGADSDADVSECCVPGFHYIGV
jgi:hypothetical protein